MCTGEEQTKKQTDHGGFSENDGEAVICIQTARSALIIAVIPMGLPNESNGGLQDAATVA